LMCDPSLSRQVIVAGPWWLGEIACRAVAV
jgi:hypothetical protein